MKCLLIRFHLKRAVPYVLSLEIFNTLSLIQYSELGISESAEKMFYVRDTVCQIYVFKDTPTFSHCSLY